MPNRLYFRQVLRPRRRTNDHIVEIDRPFLMDLASFTLYLNWGFGGLQPVTHGKVCRGCLKRTHFLRSCIHPDCGELRQGLG
uniref:Uncharacterized protein n=1 Tax=Chromera velia CCMP2878 TaxID=1169474 RepID=A0A0G4IDB2_9ALVE|eukprot:Cvel_13360.t1-p1 / transcript=Cvel_13360.t1 / gene=Cvel_13360 / organism=Chromera_velia_CCMP2878 / gene_product=hypothetical protein / transcript_product=hypothetical protein / location=Cvel_scaffold908:33716-36341(-) / protein_length=81 / sequence_SO=supercontig / SO=protein_coding / is_pseudo=false